MLIVLGSGEHVMITRHFLIAVYQMQGLITYVNQTELTEGQMNCRTEQQTAVRRLWPTRKLGSR